MLERERERESVCKREKGRKREGKRETQESEREKILSDEEIKIDRAIENNTCSM